MSDLKEAWSGGKVIGLCILAFFIPLAGWIIGGVNMGDSGKMCRRAQAFTLIVISTISAGASTLFVLMPSAVTLALYILGLLTCVRFTRDAFELRKK